MKMLEYGLSKYSKNRVGIFIQKLEESLVICVSILNSIIFFVV